MKASLDTQAFAAGIKSLKLQQDSTRLTADLRTLANMEIGYLQALQLSRVIESLNPAELALKRLKVAIVSSCTSDHLATGIRVAGVRHGLLIDVWTGQYGQYRQEIMSPPETLQQFEPDAILFSLDAASLCPSIPVDASAAQVRATLEATTAELAELWAGARTRFGCTIIQQTCLDTSLPLFGNYDRLVASSPYQITQSLNDLIALQAAQAQVGIVDVARQSSHDGIDHWFDRSRWLQAKMDIAPTAVVAFGELLARHLAASIGLARKCLVLDLDNTLWGGVVGDDGVEGLVLGEGSADGEAFLSVQAYALSLKERGIPLAVCSKNELENAQAPFLNHPEMRLKLDDISVFVANWNDKAANIQAIAQQLNLGLESLVFVDDNPAERQRVREAYPMVAVPELPTNPALYVERIARQGYFEAITFTKEDSDRVEQYAANAKRAALESTSVSMDDYLASLDMQLSHGPVDSVNIPRVTQLIGKTNQFNTTTRRYTQAQVAEIAGANDSVTLQCRLTDRFGDNGLVSVMLLSPSTGYNDALTIVNWVMSCRVFGRQLEQELMNIIVEQALQKQIRLLHAEFIPSAKNTIIKQLFADFGFSLETDVDTTKEKATPELMRWVLPLAQYQPTTTYIARI